MLVFFALGNAKVLSFALGDAKVPNANVFASQWNIGYRVLNEARDRFDHELPEKACNQYQTCQLYPVHWASFRVKT